MHDQIDMILDLILIMLLLTYLTTIFFPRDPNGKV